MFRPQYPKTNPGHYIGRGISGQILHFIFSLRWVTLVAALGSTIGAMLMFLEDCLKLVHALEMVFQPIADTETPVIATVMQATDALLFGLVLTVFAYAITFGFAINLPASLRTKVPLSMRVEGIGEIKITLIGVVLVYLVVDFATDVVEADIHIAWGLLVKPTAIVLIAGAIRLLGTDHLDKQITEMPEETRREYKPARHLGEE